MTDEEIKVAARLIDEIDALEHRKDEELVIAFHWKDGPSRHEHFAIPLGDVSNELRAIMQREIDRKRAELDALRGPLGIANLKAQA